MGECACGVVELALCKFRLQPLVEQATDSLQAFPGFVVVGILREYRTEKGEGVVAFWSGVVTRVHGFARPVQEFVARPRQDICSVRRRQRIGGLGNLGFTGGRRGRAIVCVGCTQREPRHGDSEEHHAGQDGAPGSPPAAVHRLGGADRGCARSANIAVVPIHCAGGLGRVRRSARARRQPAPRSAARPGSVEPGLPRARRRGPRSSGPVRRESTRSQRLPIP